MNDSELCTKYNTYRNNAKKRNLVFDISLLSFTYKIKQPCYICGKPSKKGAYNGLDRIDNSIGYVKHNVASCCWNCNRAKSNSSTEDFKKWISNFGEVKESVKYMDTITTIWENKEFSSEHNKELFLSQRRTILKTIWDNIRNMSEYGMNDGNDILRGFKMYDFIIKNNLKMEDFIYHFINFVKLEKIGDIKPCQDIKLDPFYTNMMLQEFGVPN